MSRTGVWLVFGAAAVTAATVLIVRATRAKWDRATAALTQSIAAASERDAASRDRAVPDPGPLASMPDPVRRYFACALRGDLRIIRVARLESAGTFRRIAPGEPRGPEEGWMPFTASQTFTTDPPGFVWSARMRMLPLVDVYVRDAYVEGRGSMQAAVLGAVPVVNARGEPGLDSGALLRYLAESPWLPTALLPGERLSWTAIDASHARATLRDGETEVSAVFEFTPAGDIAGVTADRAMSVDGGFVIVPWHGRFWQHGVRDGMRIPLRGEVSWLLDGAWRPYWRGEIVGGEYELALAADGPGPGAERQGIASVASVRLDGPR